MMTMDRNNLEIADVLQKWIADERPQVMLLRAACRPARF